MKYKTDITIVMDRSGSMSDILTDIENGFNTFLDEQKKVKDSARITLVQFDNCYEVVYNGVDIQCVPKFKLQPRGSTALYYAMSRAIDETGARLAAMRPEDRPEQVLFVTITDGLNNQDHSGHRQMDVNRKIEHQKNKYQWQFVFIGINDVAVKENSNLHCVPCGATYSMDQLSNHGEIKTAGGLVSNAMRGLSASTNSYRSQSKCQVDDYLTQVEDMAAKALSKT